LVRALTLAGGSEAAATDAVQEAFVKAHLRWRKVSQYDDPVAWIRRVAINRLRDEYRRSVRKDRAVARLAAGADAATPAPEPDALDELAAAIRELPRQQRLCVALFYLDELSVAETAQALDLSEGAVKYHLHQARGRLRTLLTDQERSP
jgi:RNA polymerase sigma-70 factor (ECF subfamily)